MAFDADRLKVKLNEYSTLIFDCDGVILDSNRVKTEAFYQSALMYGYSIAEEFVAYHINHGGISRYKKFAYLLENILPRYGLKADISKRDELLAIYADLVYEGLLNCNVASGLLELRKQLPDTKWLIVSGGSQDELRKIFVKRSLDKFFDGGIFGSPDTKEQILDREFEVGNITQSALFLGDSQYDYQAACHAGLDFLFLTGWTEVKGWKEWCVENQIQFEKGILDLVRVR